MEELQEILNEFLKIDIDDKDPLLQFFLTAYYKNDVLQMKLSDGKTLCQSMYERLKTLYKPITEDPKALKFKEMAKKDSTRTNQDIDGFLLIEQIMVGLKGGIGITRDVINELIKYHYKYNKNFVSKLFMEELNNHVGQEIVVVGKHDNQMIIEEGIIDSVDNCNFIKIKNHDKDIPFIGFKHFIIEIKTPDGIVLYRNLEDLDINRLINNEDIDEAKHKVMGVKNKKQAKKK